MPLKFFSGRVGVKRNWFYLGEKIGADELLAFIQQFASMYGAGIPLLQCLEALRKQTENIKFKDILKEVILDIEGGGTFSGALARYPQVFSPFFVDMIRTGEKGGIIDKVLERLALHIEKMQDLKRKVRGAFAYPVTVGILAFLVMIFLVVVIFPVFQTVYSRLNVDLPLPTIMMITLSRFLRMFGWVIVILLAAGGYFFYRYKDLKPVRQRIDKIKITMPVFGHINRKAAVAKFVSTFGDMLESGVTLEEAIESAKNVTGNVIISEKFGDIYKTIEKGNTLAEALEEQEFIPATVAQMISAGEASGTLPDMLHKSAVALERDLDLTIKRFIVMVEPVLTLVMACFVAFIALSIYLPIFDVLKIIQQR